MSVLACNVRKGDALLNHGIVNRVHHRLDRKVLISTSHGESLLVDPSHEFLLLTESSYLD